MTRSRKPVPQNFNAPKTCGGKYCYKTRLQAEQVILEKEILQPELTLTTYRCAQCREWHLTRSREDTAHTTCSL